MSVSLRLNGHEPTDEAVGGLAQASFRDTRTPATNSPAAAGHFLRTPPHRQPIFQTVFTGNLREVARIKLEVFDLDRFVQLPRGRPRR